MKTKTLLMVFALFAAMLAFTACGNGGDTPAPPAPAETAPAAPAAPGGTTPDTPAAEPAATGASTIGVSMPTRALQRWNQDGENLQAMLQAVGMIVDLQFANNEVPTQVNQIENMIGAGVDILVIAAIDGEALTEVLATAEAAGIPVIAYDRLIMNTTAVSYYATFDNWLVGEMQGQFIVDELDLNNQDGPFYIEFFTGDPGDNNIHFFFPGAMSVLQPFLDDGTLVSLSGQTEIMQVATPGWSTEAAQSRMENLISMNNYSPTGQRLDAVMASNDSTAQGVTNALVNAGFTADNFPVITGQDCDIISVRNMVAGLQAMSVFKDTRILADSVVEMVLAIAEGRQVPINNTTDYDNGTGIIPTFLSPPIVATIANYRELLIDSGYYTEDEIYG